jgi:MYXO-CTERM domain-containing protein
MTTSARAFVLKQAEDGEPVRWDQGTIEMRVAYGAPCGPSRSELDAALEIAVEAWRIDLMIPDIVIVDGAPPPDWGYQPAYYGEGNGIYVLCGDWPFDHSHAVTIATSTPEGRMLDADVLIDGTQMLSLLPEGGAPVNDHDLASVLTHEMGHVLGLDESDRANATMWPTTMPGDTRQRTLAADDENGALALYEGSSARLEHYTCAASPTSGGGAGPWGLITLLAAWRLRRRRGAQFSPSTESE